MESVPLAILRVNRQIGEEAKDVMAKKKDYLLSRPIRVIILFRPEDSFHFSDDTYTQSTYPRLMQCLQEEVELEKFGEEYIYTKIIGNGNKVKCQKVQGPDSKLRREILVIYDKPYITFFNSMGKSLLEFYPNSNINIYPYPGAHFERGTKPTKAGLDPVASLWVNNTTYAVFQECCFPVVNIYLRNHRNTDTANRLNSAISIATDVNGRDPRGEVDPEWLKEWQDGETLVGLV